MQGFRTEDFRVSEGFWDLGLPLLYGCIRFLQTLGRVLVGSLESN